MGTWGRSGFSVQHSARLEADDTAGLACAYPMGEAAVCAECGGALPVHDMHMGE